MLAGILAGLKSLAILLGIIKNVQEEYVHEKTKAEGKAEVAADELKHIEEGRVAHEQKKQEVHQLPDADLDARLDKWMRD